jgi:uncharacterized repeat protein (TIGR01451 family)
VATAYSATGDRTLTNTVFSASPGSNCATGTDSRCGSAVTVVVPALTITKAVDTSVVVAGGTVHYTIMATNNGAANYPSTTLSDSLAGVLDDATYNGDATATVGALSYSDGMLSWTGGLAVGQSVQITYSVTTAVNMTGDGVLTNRVIDASTGSTCTSSSVDPRCASSVPVATRTIALAGLTPSFTLAGLPGAIVGSDGMVVMTVTTNSTAGYVVSVQAATPELTGTTPGNTATTIPIDRLSVRETGAAQFRPLSASIPLVVHQQNMPSAPGGDAISNDFQIQIPFISSDKYSAILDYVASAQ